MKKMELLLPAGNREKLDFAIAYGADAVYLAGKAHSLRSAGGNFSSDELQAAITHAHAAGIKAYIAVNAFPFNADLPDLEEAIKEMSGFGPDAFIVADLGVFELVSQTCSVPIHVSTQANTTNWRSAAFWEKLGAKRLVMARELSLDDIAEIRQHVSCELEVFVHGAMCISYSGRCLLSSFMTGKHANKGGCTQPCRWKYALVEEKRPGQYFEIADDDGKGSYIMNSKDLCMIEHLEDLRKAGVDSLKVEGRIKSVYYVASVGKAYRSVLDSVNDSLDAQAQQQILEDAKEELEKVSHRPYTTGFFFGNPGPSGQFYPSSRYIMAHEFVGDVLAYDQQTGLAQVRVRNRLASGEQVEFLNPTHGVFTQPVGSMVDLREGRQGEVVEVAHANHLVEMPVISPVEPFSIVRRPAMEVQRDR